MGTVDAMTQANLVAGYNTSHGYMTLRVEATSISGQAEESVEGQAAETCAGSGSAGVSVIDEFSYPAAAQFLPKRTTVSL